MKRMKNQHVFIGRNCESLGRNWPSKSTKDMELKSLKKKYKSKGFAAGCSREVIERGANQLGWELDKLLEMTLRAMAATEDIINEEMAIMVLISS